MTLMRHISITYRCAMRYREHELEGSGLGGHQTPYLMTLYRRPGLTQDELAHELDVNKSTVTRQLALLEEKGYVYRMSDECDRRVLRVYPSEKALALREQLGGVLHAWSDYLTDGLSDAERETLMRLMTRVSTRAEDYVRRLNDAGKADGAL